MQNILITGWYGTETIGDRAILAGLVSLFKDVFTEKFRLSISSLYPYLTERTIIEDGEFLNEISEGRLDGIGVLPVSSIIDVRKQVRASDFVVFGGGPIMDIPDLSIMEYIFRYARKKNIKTAVLGCGVGPICLNHSINSMHSIIESSDLCIFRDRKSADEYKRLGGKKEVYSCMDPAVFTADYYRRTYPPKTSDYVAINFRNIAGDSYDDTKSKAYDELFRRIIKTESANNKLRLIPMHTFVIGGDDRYYLNYLSEGMTQSVDVQNRPLSLRDTMEVYRDARYCYGMRFHSVLLQTILNGNNYILDYTDPTKGKIVGLLESLGIYEQVKQAGKYVSLVDGTNEFSTNTGVPVKIANSIISDYRSIYISKLKELFK